MESNPPDTLTGTAVAVSMTVAVAPDDLWDLVTTMPRIGEFSPECIELCWTGPIAAAVPGATFDVRNHFPDGVVRAADGVVAEVVPMRRLAWTMLDHDGNAASHWRYVLAPGPTPGHTVVHHRFEHGPGMTGLRALAGGDSTVVSRRLAELATNMAITLANMERARSSAALLEEAS